MTARKKLLLLVVALFAVNFSIAHGSDSSLQRSVAALGLNTSGDTYELQVTPVGNPDGYRAAALNVTVVDGEAAAVGGYVTVFPCGDRPTASNVNFVDGQTVPNAVIAPVSADGRVCFYVYGKAHVVVDVAGYFSSGFSALAKPERFLDTRSSGVKVGKVDGSGEPYSLVVGGVSGVPSGVSTVALNVTVVDGEAAAVGGYVTVFPCGDRPTASNVNFVDGQTVPNAVIAPVSADGRVCFYVYGKAHVVVDVAGYFTSGFSALSKPERFLDTRSSGVKVGEPTRSNGVLTGGATKAPAGPVALGLNLTGASALVQTSQVSVRSVMENRVPYTARLSNLYKITASGSVEPVATNRTINVDDIVVGPNNKLYSTLVTDSCSLSETDLTTNESICIEKDTTIWKSTEVFTFPRIQFDDFGNVFYIAALSNRSTNLKEGSAPGFVQTWQYVIRRFGNGVITDMMDVPNQVIRFWHVAVNGAIFFSGQLLGYDNNGEQIEVDHATKIVTSDRRLSVVSGAQARFFSTFGTKLLYFGLCGGVDNNYLEPRTECGIRKYDPAIGGVLDEYYLSGRNNNFNRSAAWEINADPICARYPQSNPFVTNDFSRSHCDSYGSLATETVQTSSGSYFAKLTSVFWNSNLSLVFQFFPTWKPVESLVIQSRSIAVIGDDLFLAGVNSEGSHIVTRLNTITNAESLVISGTSGIDVTELEADINENKVYFRGNRLSSGSDTLGQEVLGFVDLATNAVRIQNFVQGFVEEIEVIS